MEPQVQETEPPTSDDRGKTAVDRVSRRQENRALKAAENRIQAEKIHLREDRRRVDAHARFPQTERDVLRDLLRSARRWQSKLANQPRSEAINAVFERFRRSRSAIEDRLRRVAAADLEEPVSFVMDAATTKALRDEFERLFVFLGEWLDNFASVLPAEPHAQFLDEVTGGSPQDEQIASTDVAAKDLQSTDVDDDTYLVEVPLLLGFLSRARKLVRDLELAELEAAKLAEHANAGVAKGRPRNLAIDVLILPLAQVWQMATGEYPGQTKDDQTGADEGEFAEFVTRALQMLAAEAAVALEPQSGRKSGSKAPIVDSLRRLIDLGLLPRKSRSSRTSARQREK